MSRRHFVGLAGLSSLGALGAGWLARRGSSSPTPEPPRVRISNTPPPGPTATATPPLPAPTATPSPEPIPRRTLAVENAEPGDPNWEPAGPNNTWVGGFAVPNSGAPGESIRLHLACADGWCRVEVFRLGWYGGAGARSMRVYDELGCNQVSFARDERRMVHTNWVASMELQIPEDWQSGIYVARLDAPSGQQHLVPFCVRSGAPLAPIVVLSGTLTSAAYTSYGGHSLYDYNSDGGERAFAVSLDRPNSRNWGAGDLLGWEAPFIRWLERSGLDADYLNDVDLHRHPDALEGRRLVVLNGHHEYYTNEMYDAIERAVGGGTNVAVFGSNALYWRIRFEETANGEHRTVVCYKDAEFDPIKAAGQTTIRFRDGAMPRAEAALLGIQYESTNPINADWIVATDSHWVLEGTGLRADDYAVGLMGPEYDCIFPGISSDSTEVIAASPLVNSYDQKAVAHTTLTSHTSGARVFATGALNWNYALDAYRAPGWDRVVPAERADKRLQRLAYNVVSTLSKG